MAVASTQSPESSLGGGSSLTASSQMCTANTSWASRSTTIVIGTVPVNSTWVISAPAVVDSCCARSGDSSSSTHCLSAHLGRLEYTDQSSACKTSEWLTPKNCAAVPHGQDSIAVA